MGNKKDFTSGTFYRLIHPSKWIFPTRYEIKGQQMEFSKRDFPLIWRKDYMTFVKSIKTIYLKKRLIYTDVIVDTWEGEQVYFEGLSNQKAREVKKTLEELLEQARGITVRRD